MTVLPEKGVAPMKDRSSLFRPKRSLYPHALGLVAPLLIEPAIGAPYLTVASWLREFWSWPEDRRRAWQQARLGAVLDHASGHVPFYRNLLRSRRGAGEIPLADLPIIDRTDMRDNMDAFRSDGWSQMPHVSKVTSGSSYGGPWCFQLDKQAWAQIYGAALYFWELTGWRYGEPVVMLGAPVALSQDGNSLKGRLRYLVERRIVSVAGAQVDHANSLSRARRASATNASMWYGYAGTIAAMADAVLDEGLRLAGPKAIVATAEALRPEWRPRIETAFGTRVFDEYGCNDGGILTQACPSGRYHIAENVSVVEVLSDQGVPCPPGVEGQVVVTNLHARVLPFLRYRVGDRAVLGEGPCPCGRAGLTLERLAGRETEQVRLLDGTKIDGHSLARAFEPLLFVRRWQLVQPDPHQLKVRLETNPGYDQEVERQLLENLRTVCGDGLHLTVTTTEPIEFTSAGKHRMIVGFEAQPEVEKPPSGPDGARLSG